MLFEWDEARAAGNLRKHGVSFSTAAKVFADDHRFFALDRVQDGELRWHTIGLVDELLILLVVHTIGEDDLGDRVRIISARRATGKERMAYGRNRQENFG